MRARTADTRAVDWRASNRAAARLLGATWAAAGLLATLNAVMPSGRGTSRLLALVMGTSTAVAGLLVCVMPWDRWPRRALLLLVPVSFAVVGAGPLLGSEASQRYVAYNHGGYFVVVFVWIGLTQPRWTSAALSPVAAVGYALPLALSDAHGADGVKSVTVAVPICILVGESISWIVSRLRAVTAELQGTASRLSVSESRFRTLVNRGSDALVVVAPDATVSFVSESGRRVLGDAPERIEGRDLLSLVHPEDRAAVRRLLAEPDEPEGNVTAELRLAAPGGEWLTLEAAVSPMHHDPEVGGTVLSLRDVTGRKGAEAELHRRATRDPLTGLPNRESCMDHMERALAASKRDGSTVAVLFLDLDGFKRVNDEHGHDEGDALLVAAAGAMSGVLRSGEVLARIGGDEFVAVLERVSSRDDASHVAERLISAVAEAASGRRSRSGVTASAGVAFSGDGSSAAGLLRAADEAMYAAKAAGRNRFALAA